MTEKPSPWEDEEERHRAEHAAWRQRREEYLQKLFGAADPLDVHAPAAIADFDALLGEHAAQLRSVARYTMGFTISDELSIDRHIQTAGSLVRLIQTNVAIAKVLAPRAKSKTVRGMAKDEDPQD